MNRSAKMNLVGGVGLHRRDSSAQRRAALSTSSAPPVGGEPVRPVSGAVPGSRAGVPSGGLELAGGGAGEERGSGDAALAGFVVNRVEPPAVD